MKSVLSLAIGLLAAGGAALALPAFATKPITLVVPFPPGGALDMVARAAPDGHTILRGSVATPAIGPAPYPKLELPMPQVRGGKLRALAVTGSRRLAALPDVPTLREAGVSGADVTTWFGLFAPAGTPKAAIDRLQRDAATARQVLAEKFTAQGDEAVGPTPEQFAAFVRTEHARWAKVVKDVGVKLE